jgi:hypothetical protein
MMPMLMMYTVAVSSSASDVACVQPVDAGGAPRDGIVWARLFGERGYGLAGAGEQVFVLAA